MADFCRQCTQEIFGEDDSDLSELISKEDVDDGYMAVAICERCGYIGVDHTDKCIDPHCNIHGILKEQTETVEVND